MYPSLEAVEKAKPFTAGFINAYERAMKLAEKIAEADGRSKNRYYVYIVFSRNSCKFTVQAEKPSERSRKISVPVNYDIIPAHWFNTERHLDLIAFHLCDSLDVVRTYPNHEQQEGESFACFRIRDAFERWLDPSTCPASAFISWSVY